MNELMTSFLIFDES